MSSNNFLGALMCFGIVAAFIILMWAISRGTRAASDAYYNMIAARGFRLLATPPASALAALSPDGKGLSCFEGLLAHDVPAILCSSYSAGTSVSISGGGRVSSLDYHLGFLFPANPRLDDAWFACWDADRKKERGLWSLTGRMGSPTRVEKLATGETLLLWKCAHNCANLTTAFDEVTRSIPASISQAPLSPAADVEPATLATTPPSPSGLTNTSSPQSAADAAVIDIEDCLFRLRTGEGTQPGMLRQVADYAGFLIAFHQHEGQTRLALAPDDRDRTLAAIFTSDDAFDAWFPSGQKAYTGGQLLRTPITGRNLFEDLLKRDLQGMVFNCEGPGRPIAFALQFAEMVLNDSVPLDPKTTFDGETYALKGSNSDPQKVVVQWVLEGDTLDHWSKIIIVRVYLQITEPAVCAKGLEQAMRAANPEADIRVSILSDGAEATVDFLSWPAGVSDPMENAEMTMVRMLRHSRGVLAYQFSSKVGIPQGPNPKVESRELRSRWIKLLGAASFPEPAGLLG